MNQVPHDQPSTVPSREEKLRQVERILASRTFLNARTLQHFLRYVATKTIEGHEDEVKEYTVGVQVFRKGTDFDPRTDTQVRTEASRLRGRLERYYATEGAADDLRVDLPKGHYVPQFSRQTVSEVGDSGDGSTEDVAREGSESPLVAAQAPRHARLRTGVLIGLVAVAAFWSGRSLSTPGVQGTQGLHTSPEDTLLANLWSGIAEAGNPPMAAFSNPAFLVNDRGEFFLYTESGTLPVGTLVSGSRVPGGSGSNPRGGLLSFFDAYTGVGEVSAVLSVDHLFRRLGSPVEVKRGRLVTTDDLHRRNAVFVGSPEVNGVLENLRLPGEFAFVGAPLGEPGSDPIWKERIVNLHPQPGEKKEFLMERDPATGALLAEYGVVSFLPGIAPRRTIVMLAGMLDGGTAAAAEFATSPAGVQELIDHLGVSDPKSGKRLPPFFQALIRVEYARGMNLGIHYVTGRVIQPQRSAFFAGAAGSNGAGELK